MNQTQRNNKTHKSPILPSHPCAREIVQVRSDGKLESNLSFRPMLLRQILIFGLLLGSLIGGWLGDTIGRKKATFLAYVVMGPSVIINGFVNSYEAYATLHFIYSSTLPIIWINTSVYLSETFPPNWRYAYLVTYR